jgi:hypothetical protein
MTQRAPNDTPSLLVKYGVLDRISSRYCSGKRHGCLRACKHTELFSFEKLEDNEGKCPVEGCRGVHSRANPFKADKDVQKGLSLLVPCREIGHPTAAKLPQLCGARPGARQTWRKATGGPFPRGT